MKKDLGDLKISGSSSLNGGEFDTVSISGSGKINGDVICNTMSISGSGKILGDVKTDIGKVSGSCVIDGNLDCVDFKIAGSTTINRSVKGKEFKVSGSAKVNEISNIEFVKILGSMTCENSINTKNIDIYGSLKVNGDCNSDYVKSRGAFKIEGLLSADNIDIAVTGNNYVKEIGGQNISIKQGDGGMGILRVLLFKGYGRPQLTTEVIEGDNVDIEFTNCNIIGGKIVTIGKGCNVKRVEYTEELIINDDALVEEYEKC